MGGYSVQCDCDKWFTMANAYKDHCKSTGHEYHPGRRGGNQLKQNTQHTTQHQQGETDMIGLQITAKDVKANKVVKPNWYGTKIVDMKNEVGSDKESENFIVELEGMEGDAKGVPARAVFTEKFPQSVVPFINACGKAQGIEKAADEEKGLDPRFTYAACKNLVVYCQWGTWRGKDGSEKPRNNIVDWAPLPADHELASMNVASTGTAASGASAFQG